MVQTFIQTLTYSAHKFCAQESNVKVQKHISMDTNVSATETEMTNFIFLGQVDDALCLTINNVAHPTQNYTKISRELCRRFSCL